MEVLEKLVVASSNPGKLLEINALLNPYGVTVEPQSRFAIADADENGLSFLENAIIKARHACAGSGWPALADDSGIIVDALGGKPGIRSARYAGDHSSDRQNVDKLLAAMETVPQPQRSARFYCVMAFMRWPGDPIPIIAEGVWEGWIQTEPSGGGGFGYDPVFHVPTRGCSAAELDADTKNTISHRGQALTRLTQGLSKHFANFNVHTESGCQKTDDSQT